MTSPLYNNHTYNHHVQMFDDRAILHGFVPASKANASKHCASRVKDTRVNLSQRVRDFQLRIYHLEVVVYLLRVSC